MIFAAVAAGAAAERSLRFSSPMPAAMICRRRPGINHNTGHERAADI